MLASRSQEQGTGMAAYDIEPEQARVDRTQPHGIVGRRDDAEPDDVPIVAREDIEFAHHEGHSFDPVRRLARTRSHPSRD